MSAYETSATVGGQGDIHVSGVPFMPGTEVEVIINPKSANGLTAPEVGDRLGPLLAALDHARNIDSIGSLRREELYDRNVVR